MSRPVGVTKEIIENFLSESAEKGIASDVIDRLRSTLIDNARCGETALLQAIFPEDNP